MLYVKLKDLHKYIKPYKRYSIIFDFDLDLCLTYDNHSYVTDTEFTVYQIPDTYIQKWRNMGLEDIFITFKYGKDQLWYYHKFNGILSEKDQNTLIQKYSIPELLQHQEFQIEFGLFNNIESIYLNPLLIVDTTNIAKYINTNIIYKLYLEENKIYINDCYLFNMSWFDFYNANQGIYIINCNK